MRRQMIPMILASFSSIVMTLGVSGCNNKKIADITIDRVSQELTNAIKSYDELDGFHEGLSKVGKNNKYGFIDKLGSEIITCQFDGASDFKFGVSIVKKDGKEGVIDMAGNWIIPCKFDYINSFKDDSIASASLNGKAGLIDVNGEVIIPFDYETIDNFREGLACVRINGQYGFINRAGDLVIPCIYDELYNGIGFQEGLVGVKKDGEWGYLDKKGNIVIEFNDGLTGAPFSSGLSPVLKPTYPCHEMAFINKNGQLACDYFPANLEGFRDGFCTVKDDDGWAGLINTNGEFVIPCKYSFIANGFDNEYILVRINNKCGYARKSTGEIVVPCIYDIDYSGWKFCEGLVPVKKNGKYGYINDENGIVIPFVYDYAEAFSEGFAVVQKFGKYGFVDRYGNDTFTNL